MSAYVNRYQDNNPAGVGAKPWIQLNRWDNNANYSLVIGISGTAEVNVEGTLDYINRGETPKTFVVKNAEGITTTASLNVTNTPLEAIRVNQISGTGTVEFHVMQGGAGG